MASTRTAQVALRHPGAATGDFDPATGTYPGAARAVYWTGTARIQPAPTFAQRDAADEAIVARTYLVTVELEADDPAAGPGAELAPGDVLDITGGDDNVDPSLIGRTLTITAVARGSLAWERDLLCIDQTPAGG